MKGYELMGGEYTTFKFSFQIEMYEKKIASC